MHDASQEEPHDEEQPVADAELIDDEPQQAAGADERLEQLRAGDIVAGKYRVERAHRSGFLSMTVEALHIELGQRVVLKILLAEPRTRPEDVARFLRGARAAAQIRDDHVARILDIGTLETGAPYVVSDNLLGSDLRRVLRVRERLAVPEAVDLLLQACEGLAEAHQLGIVHGNLKPSNLFLVRQSDGPQQLKVLDFCVSDDPFKGAVMDRSGSVTPSLSYLAPEQIREPDSVDARADVWALGAILHELLTGARLYEAGTTPGLLAMIVADAPTPASEICADIPAGLEAVILRCLAKDPQERPANVRELAGSLQPFASADGIRSIERITRIATRRMRTTRPPPMPSQAGDPARDVERKRDSSAQPAASRAIVHVSSTPPATEKARRRAIELGLVAVGFAAAAALGAFVAARSMQSALAASALQKRQIVADLSPAVAAGTPTATSEPARTAPSPSPTPNAAPALKQPASAPGPAPRVRPTPPQKPTVATDEPRAPRAEQPVTAPVSEAKSALAVAKPSTRAAGAKDLFDDAN